VVFHVWFEELERFKRDFGGTLLWLCALRTKHKTQNKFKNKAHTYNQFHMMDQFVSKFSFNRLKFDLVTACFTHCRNFFQKGNIFGCTKTRVVIVHPLTGISAIGHRNVHI